MLFNETAVCYSEDCCFMWIWGAPSPSGGKQKERVSLFSCWGFKIGSREGGQNKLQSSFLSPSSSVASLPLLISPIFSPHHHKMLPSSPSIRHAPRLRHRQRLLVLSKPNLMEVKAEKESAKAKMGETYSTQNRSDSSPFARPVYHTPHPVRPVPLQAYTKFEQEIVASTCRLSRSLTRDLKLLLLENMHMSSIEALILYLPDIEDSFHNLFFQHEASIFRNIVRNRFPLESIVVPKVAMSGYSLIGMPRLEQAISACMLNQGRSCRDGTWWVPKPAEKGMSLHARMMIQKSKRRVDRKETHWNKILSVQTGGVAYLALLQEIQDQVKGMARLVLEAWTERLGHGKGSQKECWVLVWARENLYPALLVLWEMHLPKPEAINVERYPSWGATVGRVFEITCAEVEERLSELPEEKTNLLNQLSEAMRRWACQSTSPKVPESWEQGISSVRWQLLGTAYGVKGNPFGDLMSKTFDRKED